MEDGIGWGAGPCGEVEPDKPVPTEGLEKRGDGFKSCFREGKLAEEGSVSKVFPVGVGEMQEAVFEPEAFEKGHAV